MIFLFISLCISFYNFPINSFLIVILDSLISKYDNLFGDMENFSNLKGIHNDLPLEF